MKKNKENLDPEMIQLGENISKKLIKNCSNKLEQINIVLEKMIDNIKNNPKEGLRDEDRVNLSKMKDYLKETFIEDDKK
ncbi:MAG: hypothetical protein ACERIH_04680 [Labilibaculum antarcticum]